MAKRIFGLLFALCLVIGAMAMIALAEEATEPAPKPAATLAVYTGTNDAKIEWAPEMSEGMTPAYAKTTAEGSLVLEGASESDYNLKAEYPTGGKPTLTMKNATLANNSIYVASSEAADGVAVPVTHTVTIGGTEDFVVVIKGTNVINGNHDKKPTTTAEYRRPRGFEAKNEGTLTIKGESKADKLTIDNYSGSIIGKYYNALTIENMTFFAQLHQTKSNAQMGILMYTGGITANAEKTNLSVLNCEFTMECGTDYSTKAIMFCGDKTSYTAANAGDILFKNSKVRIYRNNGTSSTQAGTHVIYTGDKTSITYDRCDVLVYARHCTMQYAPAVLNCKDVTNVSQNWGTQDYAFVAGSKVTPGEMGKFTATHVCGTDKDDFNCTTVEKCDMCGEAIGTAQTAHKAASDDGDCTTALLCGNEGCKVVMAEAKAAHAPKADDGDCTTAIVCGNAGCTKETTPAKPYHTSPADRKDCDTPANCTVCNKALVVGQHTGGTATCQAKAKCVVCNKEYGELAACAGGTATCKDKAKCATCGKEYGELSTVHTPGEDDKDCSTAVKCTVCGGDAVAAKEHKYTDDKDTKCDNEGCTHTRTISSNPNSGDISVLLTAAVALSSAVGFAGVTVLRKKD